ncbi:hypothetical protein RF11_02559 [Thelohanellus kitauei]|uniref:Tc1-like transposase DDE domain-containing protein n=1 Tax=Thelohanellus kitauei TaxID=669202 RepID=A0A0C2MAZ2_THEKT|nr:hypothetical protein RF11_02559 [Thelohanellus kitauei]
MSKHLSDEICKIIIKMTNTGQGPQQISEALGCSSHQMVPCPEKMLRVNKLNSQMIINVFIIDQIDENRYITIKSLKTKLLEHFEVNVRSSSISKAIGSFNYSFKRVHFVPQIRNSPENIEVRSTYTINLLRYLSGDQHIFFIDETGFNVSMRSLYGRAKNFSVACCITQSWVVHSETYERPYNREVYRAFLTNLFRTLQLRGTHNRVFVMDNVGFHKCDEIKNLFTVYNPSVLYLPPYSPFLNPIEEAFSKVKYETSYYEWSGSKFISTKRKSLIDNIFLSLKMIRWVIAYI